MYIWKFCSENRIVSEIDLSRWQLIILKPISSINKLSESPYYTMNEKKILSHRIRIP